MSLRDCGNVVTSPSKLIRKIVQEATDFVSAYYNPHCAISAPTRRQQNEARHAAAELPVGRLLVGKTEGRLGIAAVSRNTQYFM